LVGYINLVCAVYRATRYAPVLGSFACRHRRLRKRQRPL